LVVKLDPSFRELPNNPVGVVEGWGVRLGRTWFVFATKSAAEAFMDAEEFIVTTERTRRQPAEVTGGMVASDDGFNASESPGKKPSRE
jgi:hypothetical protein